MKAISRSKEEGMLDFFVGDWHNAGQVVPGPFGPGGKVTGSTTYQWGVGGKWLLYTSQLDLPGLGRYEVHGGVTFNSQGRRYDAFAANSLGNLMIYRGEWSDDETLVFTLTHPEPAGRARVVYHMLPGGPIKMRSEQRADGGDFKVYFETELVRT
jgi:hypothetical protein